MTIDRIISSVLRLSIHCRYMYIKQYDCCYIFFMMWHYLLGIIILGVFVIIIPTVVTTVIIDLSI